MSESSCKDHINCLGHGHAEYDQTLEEIKFENSIYNACVLGDLEKVKSMTIKHGQNILNVQDKNGYTCLHYSARNSHYEIKHHKIRRSRKLD